MRSERIVQALRVPDVELDGRHLKTSGSNSDSREQ